MRKKGGELSPRQLLAALEIAKGKSNREAAEVSGAAIRTVERWVYEPEFIAAVQQAQRDIYKRSIAQIVSCTNLAVVTLATIAHDSSAPHASRVSAAKAILDTADRYFSRIDIEQRLQTLEDVLGGHDL